MDHRNGTDRFVICDHLSVGIQNPSSCGLNASFPLMKLFGLTGIVIRLKHHQIDQSAAKSEKDQHTGKKNGNRLIPVIGSVGLFHFIGGHKEDNEELIDTLKREVQEETGIKLDNETINEPFLKIMYLNKDYPEIGENRESDIYYYVVKTNKLPNLENVNYTEKELKKHFELIYINLNNAIKIIKENIPNHKKNEVISRDMIIALEEYERIK